MSVQELNRATALKIRVIAETPGRLSLCAAIPDRSLVAGMATFAINDAGEVLCELLHVDENCRREGIASALFDYAESHLQKSAISGLRLTPDCVEFYKARDMHIPAAAEIKTFAEWFAVG